MNNAAKQKPRDPAPRKPSATNGRKQRSRTHHRWLQAGLVTIAIIATVLLTIGAYQYWISQRAIWSLKVISSEAAAARQQTNLFYLLNALDQGTNALWQYQLSLVDATFTISTTTNTNGTTTLTATTSPTALSKLTNCFEATITNFAALRAHVAGSLARSSQTNLQEDKVLEAYKDVVKKLEESAHAHLDASTFTFIFTAITILLTTLFLALYLQALQQIGEFRADRDTFREFMSQAEKEIEAKSATVDETAATMAKSLPDLELDIQSLQLRWMTAPTLVETLIQLSAVERDREELATLTKCIEDQRPALVAAIAPPESERIEKQIDETIRNLRSKVDEMSRKETETLARFAQKAPPPTSGAA